MVCKSLAQATGLSGVAVFALLTGCLQDPRTANQGGGNITTVATKVQSQQLDQLTPDEIQIVTDLVSELTPEGDIELSDQVASAFSTLLAENGTATFREVETLVEALIETPEQIVIPPAVLTLFVADRTANQGGGTVISAIQKVKGDALNELTPDEVQMVTDFLADLIPDVDRELTDEEAEAITAFLTENEIGSVDEIEKFVDLAKNDPDAIDLPLALDQLLEDLKSLDDFKNITDLDLDNLDLSNLF